MYFVSPAVIGPVKDIILPIFSLSYPETTRVQQHYKQIINAAFVIIVNSSIDSIWAKKEPSSLFLSVVSAIQC